ncbi:major capsid protein [Microviridae sp.]|nr:major capsid protein [Microviridae sp.]
MKSVMNHNFSQVPHVDVPRSSFNRSHGHLTAIDFDYLYPVFIDEILPGDTCNMDLNAFGRLATPIHPIMDNMFIDTFFFAVPYRLVWDNWEKFNGEQENPGDSIDYLIPTMQSPASVGYAEESIHDFLDIPPGVPDLEHSVLWHRAYNLIWNQWFRDENIQDSVPFTKDDGPDDPANYELLKRGKRHDYFTSCLPFAQKDFGNPVLLPLGTSAPIEATTNILWTDGSTTTGMGQNAAQAYTGGAAQSQGAPVSYAGGLEADLTNATAATINELRTAFQIQKMMERDARGGTRYIESIKSHFGVTSPDFRLQRTEYLGGGSNRIGITPVPSTVPDPTNPQGQLAGFGTTHVDGNGNGFTKSFTEHTLVIGLCCARADIKYQQGLNRKFSRQTRYDHYYPSFAHLGEQAVLQKEIFASGIPAEDDVVFGYNERYADMRYFPSIVTGRMRSSNTQTLDPWHLAQEYANAPGLTPEFIEQDTPIARAIALPDQPDLILDCYFRYIHSRPMPTYGVPGMIDHF